MVYAHPFELHVYPSELAKPSPRPNWILANDGVVDVKVDVNTKPLFTDDIWYVTTHATRFEPTHDHKHYMIHCLVVDISHGDWIEASWTIPTSSWTSSIRFYPQDTVKKSYGYYYDWSLSQFRWCAWYEVIP